MTKQTEAIDRLVEHVATKAVQNDTPFAEAVDALKAVTAYLAMQGKHRGKSDPPEVGETNFGTFQADLERAEDTDGEAAVRNRHRRRVDA